MAKKNDTPKPFEGEITLTKKELIDALYKATWWQHQLNERQKSKIVQHDARLEICTQISSDLFYKQLKKK